MSEWDEFAETWDTEEGTEDFNQRAIQEIKQRLELTDSCTVLDFGCGTGLLTGKLKDIVGTVVGVDTSQRMVEQFKKKFPDVEVHTIDVRQLQASMESRFDFVMAMSVLRFVEDLTETLSALVSCLKPGGRLIHIDAHNTKDENYHEGFNREIAKRFYGEAGLEMVQSDVTDFGIPSFPTEVVFVGVGKKI